MSKRNRNPVPDLFPVPMVTSSRAAVERFTEDGGLIPVGARRAVRTALAEVDRLRTLLAVHGIVDVELLEAEAVAELAAAEAELERIRVEGERSEAKRASAQAVVDLASEALSELRAR